MDSTQAEQPVRKARPPRPRPVVTPDAVFGRKHIDVQTEEYLEELTDRPVEVAVDTQTDPLLDRPATPKFVPIKSGLDVETQIYPGELFDFDAEVEPILEVLVGKILDQGLMEVMEEEELANLQQHQLEFERKRNAELAEVQRMEEAERRKLEEKERRMEQERQRLFAEEKAKEKVAARGFAQNYLANLTTNVFNKLTAKGYFYDTTVREIETAFLPWIIDQVDTELQRAAESRRVLDHLIQQALQKAIQKEHKAQKEREEALKKQQEEEREKLLLLQQQHEIPSVSVDEYDEDEDDDEGDEGDDDGDDD